jgi:endonuclease/exonuclease/phosphatase family metal-dependent hydrolase
VQELQREALETFRDRLPDYGLVLGPAAGPDHRPEYNAILYAPERLEVVETGGFWLSETPDVPSSSWRAKIVRTANWVTFAVRGTDVTVRHVNLHLDHWSGLARNHSVELVLRRVAGVAEGRLPTVVTGDFNCPPASTPHRILLGRGYQDAHLARLGNGERSRGGNGHRGAHEGADAATFHGFGGLRLAVARGFHRVRHGPEPLRFDWILVGDHERRWHVEDSAIVRDRDPVTDAPPSDHDPVIAQLRLEP